MCARPRWQMESHKRGWRTGSPTRLDALLANQSWDPLQMFGGTQRTAAPSASAVAAPAVQPAKAGSSTPTIANFVLPEWCSAAAATGVLLAWRGATLVDTVPLAGRAYLLAGRLAECDLVLEHASASRHHAIVLQHRSGAVYLLDLGSAHGTFLNGERLPPREPSLWRDGVPCVFGASSRAYVLRSTPHSAGLPPQITTAPPTATAAAASSMMHSHRAQHLTLPAPAMPQLRSAAAANPPVGVQPGPGARVQAAVEWVDEEAEGADNVDEVCQWNTRQNARRAERLAGSTSARETGREIGREIEIRREIERSESEWRRQTALADEQCDRLMERRQRRRRGPVRVRFASRPSVRYYEPPSPECLLDPEAPAAATTAATASACGSTITAAMAPPPPRPSSLPKPTYTVTKVAAAAAGAARSEMGAVTEGKEGPDPVGRFADLIEHATEYSTEAAPRTFPKERWTGGRPCSASSTAFASSSFSSSFSSSSCAAFVAQRLPSTSVEVRSYCEHTRVRAIVAERGAEGGSGQLVLEDLARVPLLALHSRPPLLASEGHLQLQSVKCSCEVQLQSVVSPTRGGREAASRRAAEVVYFDALAWRAPDSADSLAGTRPTPTTTALPLVSVVNRSARPMLIYLAVEDHDGEGDGEGGVNGEGGCTERALTPWAGAVCDAERPIALVHGGENCLLLAPFEGTSLCEAEDAEKAPFGMSNTFRYEAASGATVEGQLRRPGRQRLRLEAAFQAQPAGVPTLLGADEDDKDVEPSVEAPFCVLSVVLV